MSNIEKILWVVDYPSLNEFFARAVAVKATGVAVRTSNPMDAVLKKFKNESAIKVFGWRWPKVTRDKALAEAQRAAQLLAAGMDGYYVDPEADTGRKSDFWDADGLEDLAEEFCKTVLSGSSNKVFGITSHYLGKKTFGKLPWESFFKYSTVCLPQAYWRDEHGKRIGHGKPAANYADALAAWAETGAPKERIVPMAGEISTATAAEIDSYVAAAIQAGIGQLHFYAADSGVESTVWDAIARAGTVPAGALVPAGVAPASGAPKELGETLLLSTAAAPAAAPSVQPVDTLYEVYFSAELNTQRSRDVALFRLADRPGFFHRGSMQIDVDGSPRAYSPHNASPLRLDQLSNGGSDSKTYVQGNEYQVHGFGTVTAQGPRQGFYVSATALRYDRHIMWECDNFVDAEAIPYFIYPDDRQGVRLGDVGIVVHVPTLVWTAAIAGDSNDNRRVSEASLATAVNLKRSTINAATGKVSGLNAGNGDDDRHYFYLYFPDSGLTPLSEGPHRWPAEAIHEAAAARFDAWGGLEMVKHCLARMGA